MPRSKKHLKPRQKKPNKYEQLENRINGLKQDVYLIKLQQRRASKITLKFISAMQLLKDKGIITDDEITAYCNRNEKSLIPNGVQPQEARTNETDDGSTGSNLLVEESDGSDPDCSGS